MKNTTTIIDNLIAFFAENMIKSHMRMKDVSIECNDSMKIIALFDKTDEKIERFEKDLTAHSAYVFFERI